MLLTRVDKVANELFSTVRDESLLEPFDCGLNHQGLARPAVSSTSTRGPAPCR